MLVVRTFSKWFAVALVCCSPALHAHTTSAQESVSGRTTPPAGITRGSAVMVIPESRFDFGEADEGSVVTHEFTIRNIGKAPLHIHKVSPDCGCTLADYDRTIPPQGEGKITLHLNLTGYKGSVQKVTTVYSSDPQNPSGSLVMRGRVRILIDVTPTSHVSFLGLAQQQSEQTVELKGVSQAFRVTGVESNLEGRVAHRLETVEEGRHYRLKISNLMERGEYIGHIKVYTDMAGKREILIRVKGILEGKIAVGPKVVLIGKPSLQQPVRNARVKVVSNLKERMGIARLSYDERLLKVTQQPLADRNGFALEITPRLENLPPGSKEQTLLTIETEPAADEKLEVQVLLIHAAVSSGGAAQERGKGEAGSPGPPH